MALDVETFWRLFRKDRGALYKMLFTMYPLMPMHYVVYFVDCMESLEGNPQTMTYVESDLGAAARSQELIAGLVKGRAIRIKDARCLDIGCSNGALLRAALDNGARSCVGIDVDERRLISARKVCAGRHVDFVRLDAAVDAIPGTFDLIFCLDVVEHVSDWRRLVEGAAKALGPGGTIFLSVHNAKHPTVVLSEPHYGIPGLVLLPHQDAADLWARLRDRLKSTLDYDVATWPLYHDIHTMGLSVGLSASPWVDCAPAYDPAFWISPDTALDRIEEAVEAAMARLPIPGADADRLRAAVAQYRRDAILDFERATTEEARVGFYLKYHAQPLNVLLRS